MGDRDQAWEPSQFVTTSTLPPPPFTHLAVFLGAMILTACWPGSWGQEQGPSLVGREGAPLPLTLSSPSLSH